MSPYRAPLFPIISLTCLLCVCLAGGPFVADVEAAPAPAHTDAYGDPLPPGALMRLGTVRWRACARFLAFTPDGNTLVTGEGVWKKERVFRCWDPATGRERASFHMGGPVWPFALSPDGKTLALGLSWGSKGIVFVRISDGKELRRIADCSAYLMRICFSPDGKLLAGVGNDSTVYIWDATNGKEVLRKGYGDPESYISFSPDGKTLAVAAWSNTLRLLDVASGKELYKRELDQEKEAKDTMVAFSPDGKKLLWTGDDARSFALRDAATGVAVLSFRAPKGTVRPVAYSSDGRYIASLDSSKDDPPSFGLWDAATGKELRKLPTPVDDGDDVAEPVFSPDGKRLAASSNSDGLIHMWDVETGKDLAQTAEHGAIVCSVGFSPDGRTALTGCMDGIVRVWDADKGAVLRRIAVGGNAGDPGTSVIAFSRDRRAAVVTKSRGNPSIWNLESGKERALLDGFQCKAWATVFAPDGKTLATPAAADDGVQLWDIGTGKETSLLKVGPIGGGEFAFAPDGKTLAVECQSASSGDETMLEMSLWDVALGKQIRKWSPAPGSSTYGFLFSPDGRTVARSKNSMVGLWQPATGKELPALRLPNEAPAAESLNWLAYSPDGRTLAAGGATGKIYLWEVNTTKVRAVLTGHRNTVTSLDFSPDGTRLISGSYDTTALIWDLTGIADKKGAKTLTPERLATLWDKLADVDAGKAWRAGWRLTADPSASVAFLRKHVRPAEVDAARIAKLLTALESDEFESREAASRELSKLRELAEPAVRKALEAKPSPEARRRLEGLTDKLDGPVTIPEQARDLRCVEVLEHIGSADARGLLDELGKGAGGARLTREAKAALARLSQRKE